MTVREIMRRPVITVQENAKLSEVVNELTISRVSGFPVVNREGSLVGIITEYDIMRATLPTYEDLVSSDEAMVSNALMENRVIEVRDQQVKHFMTRGVVTIDADSQVLKAAVTMIVKNVKRLPVLSGGKLVGLVSRIDIIQAVMQSP